MRSGRAESVSGAPLRARACAAALLAVTYLVATGCGASPASEERKGSSAREPQSAPSVIAISVDGLNPTAITRLGASRLPHLYALVRGGASTLDARTEVERTETLPNHTGMLTGRPITGPDGHQVTFNTDPGRSVTVPGHARKPIASVFDVVHDSGARTAMYASKTKFALFPRSWPGSIDQVVIDEDNDRLVDRLTKELAERPARFTFVHLSAPDVAGHAHGFMGADYLAAVEHVDDLLGRIDTAILDSRTLADRAYVILTADHGGRGGAGHADATKPDDYRIPFVVDGPGVKPGADLYALNRDDYRDPEGTRPGYDGVQPVRNADLADLSTRLLGLPDVPGSDIGVAALDVR